MHVTAALRLAAVAAVAAVGLSACSDAPVAPDRAAADTPSADASEEPSPETVVAPLTGEELTDTDVADRPVVAAKIENTAAARPQAGLDAADVVFEELTEGGITRFIALFQSEVPDLVGPIRSGRPEDATVLPAYDPLLFISGARADVLDRLRDAGVAFREEDGEVLYRTSDREAPHNVFADGPDLFAAASELRPAGPTGFVFDPEAPAGAVPCGDGCTEDPGAAIVVRMSASAVTGFEYDPAAAVYRRLQNGAPQVVTGSGTVGAANVVVLATEVGDGGCCDAAGNRLSETRLTGEGRAVVLRDGRRYLATWSKASPRDHFRLTGADGRPLPLKPGKTWVLLAPAAAVPTA